MNHILAYGGNFAAVAVAGAAESDISTDFARSARAPALFSTRHIYYCRLLGDTSTYFCQALDFCATRRLLSSGTSINRRHVSIDILITYEARICFRLYMTITAVLQLMPLLVGSMGTGQPPPGWVGGRLFYDGS